MITEHFEAGDNISAFIDKLGMYVNAVYHSKTKDGHLVYVSEIDFFGYYQSSDITLIKKKEA